MNLAKMFFTYSCLRKKQGKARNFPFSKMFLRLFWPEISYSYCGTKHVMPKQT